MPNLCYCSSTPQMYVHYIPDPSPMSGKLNWGGNFLLMNYSFERKDLRSTATGTVVDMDALSLIGCISILEVFRLNRKVVCYRHSFPLYDFRRLVLHAKIFWVLAAFCRSAWNGVAAIGEAMSKRRSKMLQYAYRVRNSQLLGSRAQTFCHTK